MKFLKLFFALLFVLAAANFRLYAQTPQEAQQIKCQWNGKKIAFIGDSITDKSHVGTSKNYWQYLQEYLGITPYVYGISGRTFKDVVAQGEKLKAEHGDDFDAILIFMGTNDFNSSLPLGEWYEFKTDMANIAGGKTEPRKRRVLSLNQSTLRGRINAGMSYLKTVFPTKQIIILTPIHRGWAKFSESNVQPDESFPNRIGLYIDEYVDAIKEAANVWAVPVIDLHSVSGLYPNLPSNAQFFANKKTDLLHPNAAGHKRMAKTIAYQLIALPADFE